MELILQDRDCGAHHHVRPWSHYRHYHSLCPKQERQTGQHALGKKCPKKCQNCPERKLFGLLDLKEQSLYSLVHRIVHIVFDETVLYHYSNINTALIFVLISLLLWATGAPSTPGPTGPIQWPEAIKTLDHKIEERMDSSFGIEAVFFLYDSLLLMSYLTE